MKKLKHTKGPWLITTIDGEDCLMVGGGDGSEVVADIRLGRITGLATNGEALSEGPSHEEAMANAHLISSAPEMLAALKALAGFSLTAHVAYNFHGGGEDLSLRRIVDRAIAHAEGRELGMEVEA
jgi:hypothetical protein